MIELIASISAGIPKLLVELIALDRTPAKRAADILAFFDRPNTSKSPTEAIPGPLKHLRRSALGFRDFIHYIAKSFLETGGFRPWLHLHW